MSTLGERLDRLNTHDHSHHRSLWKRHLFADLLTLSYEDVHHYQSDYFCDALAINALNLSESITLWFGWGKNGTHLWILNEEDPQLTEKRILGYLHYSTSAVKVLIIPQKNSQYVEVLYSLEKQPTGSQQRSQEMATP